MNLFNFDIYFFPWTTQLPVFTNAGAAIWHILRNYFALTGVPLAFL